MRVYVGLMTCSEVGMHDEVLSVGGKSPSDVTGHALELIDGWDLRPGVRGRFEDELDADGACVAYGGEDECDELLDLRVFVVEVDINKGV